MKKKIGEEKGPDVVGVCLGSSQAKAYLRNDKWYVTCGLNDVPCTLLIDTGCPVTLITPQMMKTLSRKTQENLRETDKEFRGAAGNAMIIHGEVLLRMTLGRRQVDATVIVADMVHEGILGLEALTALGVSLDFA